MRVRCRWWWLVWGGFEVREGVNGRGGCQDCDGVCTRGMTIEMMVYANASYLEAIDEKPQKSLKVAV